MGIGLKLWFQETLGCVMLVPAGGSLSAAIFVELI